jgi:hypothetical protein
VSWFEHRHEPLLPANAFLRRVLQYGTVALGIVLGSLALGVLGYRFVGGLNWVDAVMNAAMILGGMGPVNELHTDASKLFAAFYALFSGIVFLVAFGVLLAPVLHRLLHHFHLEMDAGGKNKS